MLDACPGALCVVGADDGVIHVNRAFRSIFPRIDVGTELPVLVGLLGIDRHQLKADARFTVGDAAQEYGVQVRAIDAGAEQWLLSLTPIAAQKALKRGLAEAVAGAKSGQLDARVQLPPGSSALATRVAAGVNELLDSIGGQLSSLVAAVDLLAECDLRVNLEGNDEGELGRLRTRLGVTVANLTESIRQTIASSEVIGDITQKVADENRQLAERTSAQASAVQNTSANMEQLSAAVDNAAGSAERAADQGCQTMRLAEAGRQAVAQVVESMESINRGANEVRDIIGVINEIAFQTNILALNAAVEAARAGEHGRGFAIVAAEVRALAARSATAANQIRELIDRSAATTADGKHLALAADERMADILSGVQNTSEQIAAISIAAREQTQGIADANRALRDIDELTQQNDVLVRELAENSEALNQQARYLTEAATIFRLPDDDFSHPLHREAGAAATAAATELGALLENALATGQISEDDLFDYRYTEIPDTSPQKHSTPYDALADRLFPSVQERVLNGHAAFVYAIGADYNGYVPTHNAQFSQPLTGDYETDLVGNRTKRIYSDRVGQQVGRHTEPGKLQTYRRDTGELMFDMSAPILVNGRHWGGFRIGYRIV